MPVLLQYLLGLVALLGVISYGYGQWKQGRNQSQMDNDNIYKNRIDALELKVKTQSEDIEKLTEQVKKLRLDNEEANRKLLEALAILQGRDPAISHLMESANNFIVDTTPVIEMLKAFLMKQSI